MKALFWAAGILAALAALLVLLRLRVTLSYGEEGPGAAVALGPVTVLRLPMPKGKKAPKKSERTKRVKRGKKKSGEEEEKKTGGSVPGFRDMLPIISDALGKLKRRLSVDELTLWYQSGSEDPAAAALMFGRANAAAGALLQPLTELFRIRSTDVRTAVSFTDTKNRVYARLRLSLPLGTLLYLSLRTLLRYRRALKHRPRKDTEE